jgi:uncharacterized protein (DUF1501 family)
MRFEIARRGLLGAGLAGLSLAAVPQLALASAATEARFIFLMLRGGMDGLAVVSPTAEPAFTASRGALASPRPQDGTAVPLGGMFALHPALKEGAALYRTGELAFVHALATPYRERSHFDAQKLLETGGRTPLELDSGWLNRLLPLIGGGPAMAIAPVVPLALRGPSAVGSYAPSRLPDANEALLARVTDLYARDPLLHPLWSQALQAQALAGGGKEKADPATLAAMAAKFLSEPGGARIAMLEHDGWDTHAQQPVRLANQLRQLDGMLATLKSGLGPHWANTLVLVVTEFGRTVRVNGTGGTDHGTAGLAMLAGGAVNGGRVIADWPGTRPQDLLDGRDLKPTRDVRALMLGAVTAQFGLDPDKAARALFPGAAVKIEPGLLKA